MSDPIKDAIYELRDECTCDGDDAIDVLEAEIARMRAERDAALAGAGLPKSEFLWPRLKPKQSN